MGTRYRSTTQLLIRFRLPTQRVTPPVRLKGRSRMSGHAAAAWCRCCCRCVFMQRPSSPVFMLWQNGTRPSVRRCRESITCAINPGLIYVSISGAAKTGPYVRNRVYDPVIQALSGHCHVNLAWAASSRGSLALPIMLRVGRMSPGARF